MNKKTLVLGASLKTHRYSNYAIERLVNGGHKVLALGLKKGNVAGVNIDNDLKIYKDIDTITIYLKAENQKPFYNYIISLNPKRVIFNPGTENPELYAILQKNNIIFEESCTLVLLSTNQY